MTGDNRLFTPALQLHAAEADSRPTNTTRDPSHDYEVTQTGRPGFSLTKGEAKKMEDETTNGPLPSNLDAVNS